MSHNGKNLIAEVARQVSASGPRTLVIMGCSGCVVETNTWMRTSAAAFLGMLLLPLPLFVTG